MKATEWAIYYEWEDKNCSGAGVIREAALSPCIAVRKAMKRLSKIYCQLRKIKILWSEENKRQCR